MQNDFFPDDPDVRVSMLEAKVERFERLVERPEFGRAMVSNMVFGGQRGE